MFHTVKLRNLSAPLIEIPFINLTNLSSSTDIDVVNSYRAEPCSQPSTYQIYKELRHQEKVLRNNNLIMGPMTAFQEYFEPNAQYGPPRK